MRNRRMVFFVIICVALPLHGQSRCTSAKSDGLKGKVSQVTTHSRRFGEQADDFVAVEDEVVRYDVEGRLSETIFYRHDGAKSSESRCVYGSNGKPVSFSGTQLDGQKIWEEFDSEGRLLSTKVMVAGNTWELERYVRDSRGRV